MSSRTMLRVLGVVALLPTALLLSVPVAHAQAVGCTPVVGLSKDSLGYVNAQGAADCSHPYRQTASVTVFISRSGHGIEGAGPRTCGPGQFSSSGWCLSPYASASNPSGLQTFCGTVYIKWKNSAGGAWYSDNAKVCAKY